MNQAIDHETNVTYYQLPQVKQFQIPAKKTANQVNTDRVQTYKEGSKTAKSFIHKCQSLFYSQ